MTQGQFLIQTDHFTQKIDPTSKKRVSHTTQPLTNGTDHGLAKNVGRIFDYDMQFCESSSLNPQLPN